MRIVAGSAGGRRLSAPPGGRTRPTSDRVREAVFSMLESMGVVEGARVFDLFAGSGAMGIEALSRGAAEVDFVDEDPRAIRTVEANLAATGLRGGRTVISDVMAWLATASRADLAFADPPYAFDDWDSLLRALDAEVVVAESARPVDPPTRWDVTRQRRYGSTVVTVMCSSGANPGDARA